MKVLSVVGYRKSGKTTLVERLVPVLSEYGRVATVKSLHHDVEVDTPGKDTHRHRDAGAETVVGITPSLTFSVTPDTREKEGRLQETLAALEADGFDFVVVEGFKEVELPSVAVGDVETEVLGGPLELRVPGGETADIESVRAVALALPEWESAEAASDDPDGDDSSRSR